MRNSAAADAIEVPGGFGAQPHTQYYRREIDGLRAVAVIPVVLFHSGVQTFSGGFVGVDIFFVISGYLITGILARQAEAGKFSIATFYSRRIRRIFPALFVVLAATLAAGMWLFLPEELSSLARNAIATAIFCSNILLYRETGYFAMPALYKPLLHTWSLAVEEQFYIFFPLGLWLVHRWKREALLPLFGLAAAVSFALNVALMNSMPTFDFYMLPTRAWELLIGGMIAVAPPCRMERREVVAALGLIAIAVALFVLKETMPFPGVVALLPVLGTTMVIYAAEGTFTARLLSVAPMRGIGLISYSLYLWHWPVLTFARYALGSQLTPLVTLACIGFATLAAALSWRYIEVPFRRSGPPKRAIAAGLAAITVAIALAALLLPGMPSRLPPEAVAMGAAASPPKSLPACFAEGTANPDFNHCIGGPSMMIGDSHALQFIKPAKQLLPNLKFIGRGGCMPLAGVTFTRLGRTDENCTQFNSRALTRIASDPRVRTVILAGRWARFTFPSGDPEAQTADRDIGTALRDTVAMLHRGGKRVVLIGPVPEFKEPLPACLARAVWRSLSPGVCQHNPLTIHNPTTEAWLRSAGADAIIWPSRALCRNGQCVTLLNGRPASFDRDHLTPEAAGLVLKRSNFPELVSHATRVVAGSTASN